MAATCQHDESFGCREDQGRILGYVVCHIAGVGSQLQALGAQLVSGFFLGTRAGKPDTRGEFGSGIMQYEAAAQALILSTQRRQAVVVGTIGLQSRLEDIR